MSPKRKVAERKEEVSEPKVYPGYIEPDQTMLDAKAQILTLDPSKRRLIETLLKQGHSI